MMSLSSGAFSPGCLSSREELEDTGRWVIHEHLDLVMCMAKGLFYLACCTVAQPKPDNLRRRPPENARAVKIGVLRGEGVAMGLGIVPYVSFRRPIQAAQVDMPGIWIQIGKALDQARREIVVNQRLHA